MPIPSCDPRHPYLVETAPVTDSSVDVAKAEAEHERTQHIKAQQRIGAKEALQAICDAYPEGFHVLLQHDRLSEVFGCKVLGDAFNDLLSERRR
jgi:hypothetical protein